MAKKVPIVAVIALMLLTAALTVAVTVSVYTKEYNKIIGDLPKRAAQYAVLQEADELIRANYYGDFSDASLNESVLSGLLQSLNDPYSRVLSAAEYRKFTAEQEGDGKEKTVTSSASGGVGYIRISAFFENTAQECREALAAFDPEETVGVVLDLRNCAAGTVEAAARVIDLIVPLATDGTGAIAVIRNAAGETLELYSADSESVSYPFAVLVNDGTDGAAELAACDLRDFGKARLVGDRTAGHGTVQKAFQMSDGSALLLTVGEIFPYLSESFSQTGVTPDETVSLSAADRAALFTGAEINDTQYSVAAAYLSSFKQ